MCGISIHLLCYSTLKQIEKNIIKLSPKTAVIIGIAVCIFSSMAFLTYYILKINKIEKRDSDQSLDFNQLQRRNDLQDSAQLNRTDDNLSPYRTSTRQSHDGEQPSPDHSPRNHAQSLGLSDITEEEDVSPSSTEPKDELNHSSPPSITDIPNQNNHSLPPSQSIIHSHDNQVLEGEWEIILANGNFDKGIFKNGILVNGSRNRNGVLEMGTFEEDKLQGSGKVIYGGGSNDEGFFKNGRLHGQGKRTVKGGIAFQEGEFINGYLHGKGKKMNANGKVVEGIFSVGVLVKTK